MFSFFSGLGIVLGILPRIITEKHELNHTNLPKIVGFEKNEGGVTHGYSYQLNNPIDT